ncbi:MAG: hypothetical protein ACE5G7_03225 [Candidatus Hydrothermarchaeaceae archaeon]
MGRTVATYRNLLETEIARWRDYRRALRKGDQELFDELLRYARKHSSASGYHVSTNPFETMAMSILLEFKRELERLKRETGK